MSHEDPHWRESFQVRRMWRFVHSEKFVGHAFENSYGYVNDLKLPQILMRKEFIFVPFCQERNHFPANSVTWALSMCTVWKRIYWSTQVKNPSSATSAALPSIIGLASTFTRKRTVKIDRTNVAFATLHSNTAATWRIICLRIRRSDYSNAIYARRRSNNSGI